MPGVHVAHFGPMCLTTRNNLRHPKSPIMSRTGPTRFDAWSSWGGRPKQTPTSRLSYLISLFAHPRFRAVCPPLRGASDALATDALAATSIVFTVIRRWTPLTLGVQPSLAAMLWRVHREDAGEHFCDSTLDAPLTLGVQPSLNWSLRQMFTWGAAETHHFMFAHATGRLCTPPSNRPAAVLTCTPWP